ncbi:hypothetical protein J1N35_028845 [Gossypium stocksii]|uniref:Uncharacterized protein n=1 Tax=Gossypium stocksii TaxID=47602 RepID=A0A9D3UWZ1_9ROSI|nr:hypothetical protein J1N35_028845 [Gossypium stocksii]
MANSIESTFAGSFFGSRLIQSFPRQNTVKLDDGSFVQWQQHVRLIVEGHELQGFLDGTLHVLARFVTSPDGALTLNPDASYFIQQDKLLTSWCTNVKEYISKIQNTCTLLEASSSVVSKAEKVEVILAGLLSDFDVVLTLASFFPEPLPFQKIVEVLLEFENRQIRTVLDAPFHANLVEMPLNRTVADSTHDSG